jgi:hypothetical protein
MIFAASHRWSISLLLLVPSLSAAFHVIGEDSPVSHLREGSSEGECHASDKRLAAVQTLSPVAQNSIQTVKMMPVTHCVLVIVKKQQNAVASVCVNAAMMQTASRTRSAACVTVSAAGAAFVRI